jgi:hypothetical protein
MKLLRNLMDEMSATCGLGSMLRTFSDKKDDKSTFVAMLATGQLGSNILLKLRRTMFSRQMFAPCVGKDILRKAQQGNL